MSFEEGMRKLIASFTPKSFESAVLNLQHLGLELNVPRFRIDTELDFVDTLKGIGMPSAFSSQQAFGRICDGTDSLIISNDPENIRSKSISNCTVIFLQCTLRS